MINLAYGGDGNDQMTGLDNFYDRLFGEGGDDVLLAMGQDVMDGGSGNDELYLVIEPRLIRPTLELDYSGLDPVAGSVTDPADAMADAVSIENFDLLGENQSHEDLEDEWMEVSLRCFCVKLTDKDHLMRRYAPQT